jgi:hypothetical protein
MSFLYKIVSILLLCITSIGQLSAQIFPKENSKLWWRIIGFSFPAQTGSNTYTVELAKGDRNSESDFEKNKIISISRKTNKVIAEVPSFGSDYTWRTVYVSNNNIKTKSILHHFSVAFTPDADSTVKRLRVIKSAEKFQDHYVFVDCTRVLYDMNGNPVWVLPNTDQKDKQNAEPHDIKVTPEGTITFFTGWKPYEITYAGDLVWNYEVSTDRVMFHHEFTKLQNGHYMGMILQDISGKLPVFKQDNFNDTYDSAGFYRSRIYNSIVEFDKDRHLVWSWNGMDYENNSDLHLRRTADVGELDCDLHDNAFYFDEKNKMIYLSLRNISRIIKIKYPEGTVVNTYGTIYEPGIKDMENELFCLQHSGRISQKGYLYLYNNNSHYGPHHIPTIEMFREPAPGKSELKKIWEYQCTVEGMDSTTIQRTFFYRGGSVMELPDRSMLVNMSIPYPKIFIVSLDKKILWCAMPEKYDPVEKKWIVFQDYYRATIITRKQLEQMIWRSQK